MSLYAIEIKYRESGTGLTRTYKRLVGRIATLPTFTRDDAVVQAKKLVERLLPPWNGKGYGYPRAQRNRLTYAVKLIQRSN